MSMLSPQPSSSPKPPAVLGGVLLTLLILVYLVMGTDGLFIRLFGTAHIDRTYFAARSVYWLYVAVIWAYAVGVEKQPFLLWKENSYSIGTFLSHLFALTGIILVSVIIVNIIQLLITHKKETSEVLQRMAVFFKSNKFLLVYTALTAGVTEELLFRAYLLPRLEMLLKNSYAAIFLSALIFGLAHYRFGTIQNVLDPFIIGLILAIYYWRYRNIKVTILFHFLWDLVGLLLLIRRP